jgi:2,3-bisphosphoglycerate-independent phosphoglycerate mutase
VLLLIRDGWGYRPEKEFNATLLAKTPVHDKLYREFPCSHLTAHGRAVGLPDGIMGNSEVGHLNLGAGRRVLQEVQFINESIEDGSFFKNEAFLGAVNRVKKNGSALHLFGLCSDGIVHSSLEHLYALLKLSKEHGLKQVYVHCFMDGRDTPTHSGIGYIKQIEEKIKSIGTGKIATVMGRYYAMDRDKRWQRIELAYKALTAGEGNLRSKACEAMEKSYAENVTDEFVVPAVITEAGKPVAVVKAADAVIFFNFRADRARQITRTFFDKTFAEFPRPEGLYPYYVQMTPYDAEFPLPAAFRPHKLTNILSQIISECGMRQLRIAETEKYAHVTFFFSGGVEAEVPGEDRALISSPKVATYDLKPEMSAHEVTDEAVKRIRSGVYDFMALNFANPDMVGHTGVLEAAISACETVDLCVGRVLEAVEETGGAALVTADHGNCEMMRHKNGEPHTQHTLCPVHCVMFDKSRKTARLKDGILADVAPTLLGMLGLPQPLEMTGSRLDG